MQSGQKLYRKHNSFVALHSQNPRVLEQILARITTACTGPAVEHLAKPHRDILDTVLRDLKVTDDTAEGHFRLSPNVIEEINRIDDDAIPRYLVHRYRYEWFPQKLELDDYPPYLQIEPTSICNFRCVFCYQTDSTLTRRANGHMGHMPLDLFRQIIDQAEGNIEFISLASRGEPLLCKEIDAMLDYTRGKFLNLKMNTNASKLDEAKCHTILQSGIRTLVFSADAADEELYSQLRVNGKLPQVLENVRRFQHIRETRYPDSKIITRVSGVKYNEQQNMEDMQALWGELVDQVAFVDYNPWENPYDADPTGVDAPCSDLWRRMFVWWDGRVNPCDVDFRSHLCVGTTDEGDLSALWRSDAYETLRQKHLTTQRNSVMPCNRCTVI